MINPSHVDAVLENVNDLLADSSFTSDVKDQYFQLSNELKYLKLYMLCLAKWKRSPFGRTMNFGFVDESRVNSAMNGFKVLTSHTATSELLQTIQLCKPKIKEDCLNFLECSFECDFSTKELSKFMSSISASLHNILLDSKADSILEVKVKIETLKDNLDLFKEVFEFAVKRCSSYEDLKDFETHTQAWACCAACVSLVCWVLDENIENKTYTQASACFPPCLPLLCWVADENKEIVAPRMDVVLSDLHKKISPSTSEVARMYLAVLVNASNPPADDNSSVAKLVMRFVKFLIDNLEVDRENDGIQMLFDELIFLITFLMDRLEIEKFAEEKLIITEANAVVDEVASLISLLTSGEIKESIAEERNFALHTFLEKARAIKAEVRKRYPDLLPYTSSLDLPKINVLGSIDSLVEDLKEFCFPNHQIMMLQKELLSLKESNLERFSIPELQIMYQDIKDLRTRIVNAVCSAERALSSFIDMKVSIWRDILCLSDVIEEVQLIKGEVKRINDQPMFGIHTLDSETSPRPQLPLQANIPTEDKDVVGFKDEGEAILSQLTGGPETRRIISIVGMPGVGKTTLAKKVYNDVSVRFHFHKWAWCSVSQQFRAKSMLLDILRDTAVSYSNLSNMAKEDLEEKVYRSLKGQRYFIVMDDVWDVKAWYELKASLPEDNNGSRIMFTSRYLNVIPKPPPFSATLHLKPLSKEQSWVLLRRKLFDQDSCPSDFDETGRKIATECKGLPLSIVLIAGLLKKQKESLDWWEQVFKSLDSLVNQEGCEEVLALSYQHLPAYLKPCFLYFGLFQEDEEIRVKKLIQLWISEAFIKDRGSDSLEDVAEGYLMDLVARSLVIVTKRSSTGGIKACTVHDLLHDFCIAKGEKEQVCKVIRGDTDSDTAAAQAHHRVGIQTHKSWSSFIKQVPHSSAVHSLLTFPSIRWESGPKYINRLTYPYFEFLRVLNLHLNLAEFPEGITKLVYLRYLALYCGSLYIPPSLKKLENLETLCLQGENWTPFDKLRTLWKMEKLRHVSLPECIPTGFSDDMPPLLNMQTFSLLILPYGEEPEMVLTKIPTVRKLRCRFQFLGASMKGNQIVRLDFLSCLESLSIESRSIGFDKLSSCVFHFPETLKKLNLMNFGLPWSEISPIACLPHLEVLKLHDAFRGKTWGVEDGEFPNLKCLVLKRLDIKQLKVSEGSFPFLERLEVENCRNLVKIPHTFGELHSLMMIQVKNCRSKLHNSVRKIQKEKRELGNEHFEVHVVGETEEDSTDADSDSSDEFKELENENLEV